MNDADAVKEIGKQMESYNFQVRAIAWQILISLFISVAIYFLGAKEYALFFLFLTMGCAFFLIVVVDYRRIKYSVISRERGLTLDQLRHFRRLIVEKKYEYAIKFLSVVDKNATGKDELIKKVRLLMRFEKLIAAKKISWEDLDEAARNRNYKISRNYMSGDYFTISIKELEAILKSLNK